MTDSTLNRFIASGTNAERLAFTPSPPTPGSGPDQSYIWHETDTGDTFMWDFDASAWDQVNGASGLANDLTFDTSGGATAPAVFDGSAAKTIDYSTVGAAKTGAVTGSGLTMATARLLGRTTPSSGAVEEISMGSGLSLSGGSLSASGGAMALISEQTPSGTGTVTFSSIAATYRDLVLIVRGRGDTTATSVGVKMRFNNDSGTNYDRQRLTAASSSVSGAGNNAATEIDIGTIAAASATTNVADSIVTEVFDYRGTTFEKATHSHGAFKVGTAFSSFTVDIRDGWWRSTAAISRLDVILAAGSFVAGSVVSLYGRM